MTLPFVSRKEYERQQALNLRLVSEIRLLTGEVERLVQKRAEEAVTKPQDWAKASVAYDCGFADGQRQGIRTGRAQEWKRTTSILKDVLHSLRKGKEESKAIRVRFNEYRLSRVYNPDMMCDHPVDLDPVETEELRKEVAATPDKPNIE